MKSAGKLDQAVEIFEKIVEDYPDYPQGWHNLGATYYSMKKYEKAEEAFSNYLKLEPRDAGGYLYLGHTLFSQGKLKKARLQIKKALDLNPNLEEARKNLTLLEKMIKAGENR